MRLLPRSASGTWLLTAAAWAALCVSTWFLLPLHPRAIISAAGIHWPFAFSPDGRILLTREADTNLRPTCGRFWDSATGQPIVHLPETDFELGHDYWSADGNWLLLQGSFQEPASWLVDLRSGHHVAAFPDPPAGPPAFSQTEPLLAWPVGTDWVSGPVQLLELPSLRVRAEFNGAAGGIAFSPDGRTLAARETASQAVGIWDVTTARRIALLPLPHPNPNECAGQLAYSPDGRWLMVTTDYRFLPFVVTKPAALPHSLVVWDVATGRSLFSVAGASAIPPVRADLLLAIVAGRICGYDPGTGAERYATDFGDHRNSQVAAGGKWFAANTEEPLFADRVRRWLRARGLPVPDSVRLVSTVRLFDAATCREMDQLPNVGTPVLSPDGRTLAVITTSGQTQIWDVPWAPSLGWFALAAAGLALPLAGLAWRRSRHLRREVA
jgi:WD40 repeat protein